MSWRRGPPAAKPAAGGFDTPKVRPAEGLMPGLLKLKPELLLPKPRKVRTYIGQTEEKNKGAVKENGNQMIIKDAQEI